MENGVRTLSLSLCHPASHMPVSGAQSERLIPVAAACGCGGDKEELWLWSDGSFGWSASEGKG